MENLNGSALRLEALHRSLAQFNHSRLEPSTNCPDLNDDGALKLEREWIEAERAMVHERACLAPCEPEAFVRWFEDLKKTGPGQQDPLFDYLETAATLATMTWFLTQEVAGEAGFDDLIAMTQVKMPVRAKLEMARNYWDEMGQGTEPGMHGGMLTQLASELNIASTDSSRVVWESLALSNLMMGLAANRHYAFQSVGALGVIELTAPGRAAKVNAGLKRLGVDGSARRYFALHATIDLKHSRAWNTEILGPLVGDNPFLAPALAEGALMRLAAGKRCFDRYRKELARERFASEES